MSNLRFHIKETLILAGPVMLTNLSHMVVGLTDTIMIGQYDAMQLSAASFITNLFGIAIVIAMGFMFGITPLVAPSYSSKQFERVKSYFSNGFYLTLFFGFFITTLLFLLAPNLSWFGQDLEVTRLAIPFFMISASSLPFVVFFFFFKQFCEGLSNTTYAMLISFFGNGLNIFLNYIWIHGLLGFPEMGYLGAAYASLVARFVMAALMVFVVLSLPKFRGLYTFNKNFLNKNILKEITKMGLPISGQFLLEAGAFSAGAIVVGWLGYQALAAHQIALMVAATLYMVPSGISSAATIRIGNFIGLNDYENVRRSGYIAMFMTFFVQILFATCVFSFRSFIPEWFVKEADIQEMVAPVLVVVACFQISDGMMAVGLGMLRGLQDVKIPLLILTFAFWVFGLPLGFLLSQYYGYGVPGMWIGFALALSIGAVIMNLRFHIHNKPLFDHARLIDSESIKFGH